MNIQGNLGLNEIGCITFSELSIDYKTGKSSSLPVDIKTLHNDKNKARLHDGFYDECYDGTPLQTTSETSGRPLSHEGSFQDSDSMSWTTSTDTSRSPPVNKSRQQLLSSTSCPEEFSVLESPSDHVSVMLNGIKNSNCTTKEKVGFNFIFGQKDGLSFPFVEQHIHLEGLFTAEELKDLAEKESLYYEASRGVFRRKPISSKNGIQRVEASQVSLMEIKSKACVSVAESIFKFEDLSKESAFDSTFRIRGSILDRVKISSQLLIVMKKAKEHNILYRELMYGIYDIPVPASLIEFTEELEKPLENDSIDRCLDFLNQKLNTLLSEDEKVKLKTKIKHRFSTDDAETEKFFASLIEQNYAEAKEMYLKRVFEEAESEIKEAIAKDKRKSKSLYGLDSSVSIFSKRSVRTLKLIDEIMRHKSLGEFIAWAYAACYRIEKTKELEGIEVGITVDGPQNKSAKLNFESQINFLLRLRKDFPRVPVSMHALEYPTDSEFEVENELEQVIKVCEAVDGLGKGRIGHGTRTADVENIGNNLDSLIKKRIAIEFSATTAELTTDTAVPDMPIGYLHSIGMLITFNTDDPGIFGKTSLRSEIARIIKIFKFSYEDIKNAMRASLESAFANGSSIYKIKEINEKKYNGYEIEAITKLKYQIKENYLMYCKKNAEDYEEIPDHISEKAYKQILLERAIEDFEADMFSEKNVEISRTLGLRHRRSTSNPEQYLM